MSTAPASPIDQATGAPGSVGIVVVNHQRPAATRRCAAALARLTHADWFLVLVENGSNDFGAAELAALGPRAVGVRSATNRGFAAGANLGMRAALERGADWVWFLNDDAEPEPDALGELLAVATGRPAAAIVGPKIVAGTQPERLDSVALDVDLERGRVRLVGHGELDRGQYDGLSDPVAVTGCALLASRRACEWLSGFDESYFAYLEDADLCLRARHAGLRVAYAPLARVRHHRAPATRGRQSVDSLYYATRNHLRLLQWHSPSPPWVRKLQELRVVAWNFAFALRAGTGTPLAALGAVRRGVRDFRRNATGAPR